MFLRLLIRSGMPKIRCSPLGSKEKFESWRTVRFIDAALTIYEDTREGEDMQAINNPLLALLDGRKQFMIPAFQRDYSWTTEQCKTDVG